MQTQNVADAAKKKPVPNGIFGGQRYLRYPMPELESSIQRNMDRRKKLEDRIKKIDEKIAVRQKRLKELKN